MASRCPPGRGPKGRGRAKIPPESARSRARARLREKLRRALWGDEGQGFSVQLGHFVDQVRGRRGRRERSASRANLADRSGCGSINPSGLMTCGSVVVVPLSDLEDTQAAVCEIASRGSKIEAIVLDARGEWIQGYEWIGQLLTANRLLTKAGPVCVIAGPSSSDLAPYDAVPAVRNLVTRPTLELAIWAALALAGCASDPPPND
jgi:hypothetical protein